MLRRAGRGGFSTSRRRARCDARENPPLQHRPLLIAGGPALTMNPEPLAPFFDAIVIGEAEELLPRLIETLREGIGRRSGAAARCAGRAAGCLCAVPVAAHGRGLARQVERQWVRDPEALQPVSCLYTPDTEFAEMHLIEIARGLRPGVSLLPGRLCLPSAPRAAAAAHPGLGAGGAGAAAASLRAWRPQGRAGAGHRVGVGSRLGPFTH